MDILNLRMPNLYMLLRNHLCMMHFKALSQSIWCIYNIKDYKPSVNTENVFVVIGKLGWQPSQNSQPKHSLQ